MKDKGGAKQIEPLVSICMVTYNRAHLIGEAIESVLSQTYSHWELIIIDDASTDITADVVASYSSRLPEDKLITYTHKERQYISRARNKALSLSSGKYIAVLDSDDVWSDVNKLAEQVEYLEGNSGCVALGTQANIIDTSGAVLRKYVVPETDKEIRANLLWKNPFIHSSVMFRREDGVGYDEALTTAEDYDLFLRLGQKGDMANLSLCGVGYRVHEGNITKSHRLETMKNTLAVVKKYSNVYPGAFWALLRRRIRLVLYKALVVLRINASF